MDKIKSCPTLTLAREVISLTGKKRLSRMTFHAEFINISTTALEIMG